MRIVDVRDIEAKDVSGDPLFFGGKVTTQIAVEEDYTANKIQVMMVNFAPGARNKLHTHTTGQILIVTNGRGIIATKDQEHTVTPGMIAFIPKGEEHWHGATEDSSFAHLSILGQPHEFTYTKK